MCKPQKEDSMNVYQNWFKKVKTTFKLSVNSPSWC